MKKIFCLLLLLLLLVTGCGQGSGGKDAAAGGSYTVTDEFFSIISQVTPSLKCSLIRITHETSQN